MRYLLRNGGICMAGDFIITGGRPLSGTVRIPAAKNSVLPLLAATILCSGPVRLRNVPPLADAWLAPAWRTFAQLFALHRSAALGLSPDNPFPDGTVNRVVKGVTIHHG